mmetsp:Transcript_5872/g.14906  ORF Transcript_5872/g.14906 Transcript_5872/m.14906 type:complete len:85 (+) Transcript_5872:282-536(+)
MKANPSLRKGEGRKIQPFQQRSEQRGEVFLSTFTSYSSRCAQFLSVVSVKCVGDTSHARACSRPIEGDARETKMFFSGDQGEFP